MTEIVTSTDLYAGGGGSSEGLRQAGIHVEIAANHSPLAMETHRLNHPETEHRIADLSQTDWRTFPSSTIAWVSPSCVWHARAGGRKRPPADVERMRADAGAIDRATAFAVIEAAEVHRYRVIFIENVPEFTTWSLFPWWLDGLRALGYTIQQQVLDAFDFSHAQHRYRWFAAATLDGLEIDMTVPERPRVYASEIIDPDTALLKRVDRPMYITPQLEQITERDELHLLTYRRNARARRADAHPLATVAAGGNHHAVGLVDAQGGSWQRMVKNRELARAQGFGDDYQFLGNIAEQRRMIGNAVPVGIARFLGERAVAALAA